jgi:hypothetical protein
MTALSAESTRYTMRHSGTDKRWYVCESGLEIAEYKMEQAARKYCDRINKLVRA